MPRILQTNGLVCPFPLVEAKQAMQEIAIGEELIIYFDCTQATQSIPEWVAQEGYEVTEYIQTGDAEWKISIKKTK
ncbi:sulfurtransferase TusA family protein [Helicobacter sp. 13S00477-4]|uniref:sulfurtransferase TusA family protein n=1 Tax=Helicobacter sp. 13S00477-4 TaxID=1905759 RepID=UPI000BA64F7D|nr:sulfurtransferase TusA family protein [Helicobacter sp. 13S00477-4]PAF52867.1 oxidoreductase [Helicobacter sp. 13S00477-4]